ncbi:MAG TPA: IS110 family transposase [Niabella sp.]|jgi:transposase|nr:IS110 family transposase [Niabella sp.]
MSVKFVHFAGIDVSKSKIDVCILMAGTTLQPQYGCFDQSNKGFACLKKWLLSLLGKVQIKELLICIENTGHYNDAILHYLEAQHIAVCVENAANIKKSVRDLRAKNDKKDAYNIARYMKIHDGEVKLWEKPRTVVSQLKQLLAQRRRLISTLKALKQPLKEKNFYKWSRETTKTKDYSAGIKGLEKDIKDIDQAIRQLAMEDEPIKRQVQLITSIPSVGPITAYHLICYTNEFKNVMSGKQLASYCGVAPFLRTSGSSIRIPARVSHLANKVLKSLLHMCALTAVKMKNSFGAYFQSKTAKGKNKMLIINALRNKIILTIVAVVQKQQPFDKNYVYLHNNLEKP